MHYLLILYLDLDLTLYSSKTYVEIPKLMNNSRLLFMFFL